MNKKIIAIAILTIIAVTVPVLAGATTTDCGTGSCPTAATPVQATTLPPEVVAKAEWLDGNWDDNAVKPWLQVFPASGFNATKKIGYMVVAMADGGIGALPGTTDLPAAFAEVYHPDGSKKYQVVMPNVISCDDNPGQLMAWVANLQTLADKKLLWLTTGEGSLTLEQVKDALYECSAKLYYGYADIHNCQMCGEFKWTTRCDGQIPCTTIYEVADFSTGYKVEAYVFNKGGVKSDLLTNYFEFICQTGIETDFNKIDYGNVQYNQHKWVQGNKVWETLGIASETIGLGYVRSTIRNIGNIPITLTVLQDDMGFGQSTGGWNVLWDTRLGEVDEHTAVSYDPYVTQAVPGDLAICQMDKISFSILPKKVESLTGKIGTIAITALKQVGYPYLPTSI